MRINNLKIAALMAATVLAGCRTAGDIDEIVAPHGFEFSATTEQDSKTALNGTKILWMAGDEISIFQGSAKGSKFVLAKGENTPNGTFSIAAGETFDFFGSTDPDATDPDYIALYPYDAAATIDGETVIAVLPAAQTYAENSFGNGAYPMIARSASRALAFKNVCGGIELPLKNDNGKIIVKSVKISGNNGEKIAGEARIETGDVPTVVVAETGSESVTLDCGEGVALDAAAKSFILALPPTEFANGITIEVVTENGVFTKTTANAVSIVRSGIRKMAELQVEEQTEDAGYKEVDGGYEIYSAKGLQWLAEQVNEGKDFAGETIVLADNMNLEGIAWTPIGNCSRSQTTGAAFRGTFDGNGKVISNLNCALDADNFGAGLFGLLDGATVKNVTIDSGEISNSADCAGAICGVMVGESVIENCHNTGATISAKGAAGGIVGRAYSKSNDTIKGCTNSAQVSGAQKVGGIVAIASNGGTHNIENCQNSGSVSGGNAGVGGIVGHTGGNQPTTVKNCTNTGTVGIATDLYAAGIVGFSIAASCNIENSNNEGAITAINAGGIFGCVGSTQATNISGCENHGDVTGVKIAGGISAGASSGTLENCKNTATITASAEGGIAGGIAGQYRNAAIVNCAGGAASAAVTAQYAGRIIGLALNGTVFANNMPEDARLTLDDSNGDDYSGISSIGAMGMYTSGGSIIIAGGTLHGLPIQAVELSHIRIEDGAAWDMYPNETGIWTSDKIRPWGREGLTETTDGYDITNTYGILHFAQMVNNGVSTFSGKTILLKNNLNLDGIDWKPIGNVTSYPSITFAGTFDGGEHTISNLTTSDNTTEHASAGLFGSITGKVRNLKLENVNVSSSHYAGAIVGYSSANVGMEISNCHVNGGTIVSSPEAVNGGHNNGDKVGGIIGYTVAGDVVKGCSVSNITVSGYRDIGGIAGGSAANVSNCTATAVTIVQDNTDAYKNERITTYKSIIGRDLGGTKTGNTASNMTYCIKNLTTTDALSFTNASVAESGSTFILDGVSVQSVTINGAAKIDTFTVKNSVITAAETNPGGPARFGFFIAPNTTDVLTVNVENTKFNSSWSHAIYAQIGGNENFKINVSGCNFSNWGMKETAETDKATSACLKILNAPGITETETERTNYKNTFLSANTWTKPEATYTVINLTDKDNVEHCFSE